MADGWFAAIELLLVFGGVMAWIAWGLRSLKRHKDGKKTGKIERIVNRRSEILTGALEMLGHGPTSAFSLADPERITRNHFIPIRLAAFVT